MLMWELRICIVNVLLVSIDPAGCVATTALSIIRDAKVRMLVAKGPSYREQNWKMNEDICRQDVAAYKRKWSKRGVDIREWEHKVH